MAVNQLSSNYSVGRLSNYVVNKGSEIRRLSADLFSRSTVPQRIVAAVTLLTSIWIFSLSHLWNEQENISNQSASSKQGTLAKLKKLRVVRFSVWVAGSFLTAAEFIITPKGAKLTSQHELPTNHSDPANVNQISNESSGACRVHHPSENMLPMARGVRCRIASRIRAWRHALQDECDGRSGYYELHCTQKRSSFLSRAWKAIFGRQGEETETSAVQEVRKRKRPDGDDCLTLYVPMNKGVHRLNDVDSRHAFSEKANEAPIIQGLSIIPIIGNWYSAEISNGHQSHAEKIAEEQLDHISLVQRDHSAQSKQSSEYTSDGEQYEILDMEVKNVAPSCVD